MSGKKPYVKDQEEIKVIDKRKFDMMGEERPMTREAKMDLWVQYTMKKPQAHKNQMERLVGKLKKA